MSEPMDFCMNCINADFVENLDETNTRLYKEIAKLREELAFTKGMLEQADDFLEYERKRVESNHRRAERAEARIAEAEPVDFFCNATRFKADSNGCIQAWPELAGRWVALVPAEDDCHLSYTRPMPPADVAEQIAKTREESYEQGKRDAVPDGWQVVPKEPTDEMIRNSDSVRGSEYTSAKTIYRKMIAAAPKPTEVKP